MYSLTISEVPSYPFKNTYFKVNITLLSDCQILPEEGLRLNLKLYSMTSRGPVEAPQCLTVGQLNQNILPQETLSYSILINKTSLEEGNSGYYLESSIQNYPNVSIKSKTMYVVKEALSIPILPEKWHRDYGGRDNHISTVVKLVDSKGNFVSRSIPLKVTLKYAHDDHIPDQGLLTFAYANQSKILFTPTSDDNHPNFRFRIEGISRNYQNRKFLLFIEPDVRRDPHCADISPVFTSSVSVLSKPKGSRAEREKKEIMKRKNTNIPNSNFIDYGIGMDIPEQKPKKSKVCEESIQLEDYSDIFDDSGMLNIQELEQLKKIHEEIIQKSSKAQETIQNMLNILKANEMHEYSSQTYFSDSCSDPSTNYESADDNESVICMRDTALI